jgi:capsular exopolysaccharide synthesis family protein
MRAREAFRVLRANLAVAMAEVDNPCIVVTSATENEGKTSTCVALAESVAAAGSRVALVDLDLRDPDVHRVLGGHCDVGASDVLRGHRTVEACLQQVQFRAGHNEPPTGLQLLAAGPAVANPTELLSEPRLRPLLHSLTSIADIVFIDSPPVLAVADTLLIGQLTAGAVLVVEAGGTPVPTVQRTKDALVRSRVPVLGVVLNKFDNRFAPEGFRVELGYRSVPDHLVSPPGAGPGPQPVREPVDPEAEVPPTPLRAPLAGAPGRTTPGPRRP